MSLPDIGIQVGALLNNAGTAMTDIAAHAFSVTIDRGGDRRIEQPDAGRCEIALHNTDGVWDEANTGGSATLIPRGQAIGVHVRASQTTASFREWVFCGRIVETFYDYDVSGRNVVRIIAYDGLYGAQSRPATRFPLALDADIAGEAIADLRNLVLWKEDVSAFLITSYPSTDVDRGVTTTQRVDLEPGKPALDYMRQIADGEQGWLYASPTDSLIFQGRYDLASGQTIEMTNRGTAAAGTAYSPIPYQQMSATAGGFDLITECTATTVDGSPQTSSVGTATYGASAVQLPELIVANDDLALGAAETVTARFGTLTWRPTSFTFQPLTLGTAVQSKLRAVDLLSPLPYSMTLPSGTSVAGTAVITRISHEISPADYRVTYGCSVYANPSGAGFFTLDTSALGTAGTDTLAY